MEFNFENINEKFGVVEFENSAFESIIDNIPQMLKNRKFDSKKIIFKKNGLFINEPEYKIKFNILNIDLNLKWLKTLKIYYSDNIDLFNLIGGYGISPNIKSNLKEPLEKELESSIVEYNKHFETAPILIYIDNNIDNVEYASIIYHEIGHLYDRLFKKNNFGLENSIFSKYSKTSIYEEITNNYSKYIDNFIKNQNYDFDIIEYIMNFALYYSNISEIHAFNENIYFEMLYKLNIIYDNLTWQEKLFKCIPLTHDIYDIKVCLEIFQTYPHYLNNYFNNYKDDIQKIYPYCKNSNQLIKIIYNKICHLWNQICKIYNHLYYKILTDKKKKLYENQKNFYKYCTSLIYTYKIELDEENNIIYKKSKRET